MHYRAKNTYWSVVVRCLALTAFAQSSLVLSISAVEVEDIFPLNSEKHLFLDEFLLDRVENAELVVNPPQRKELVLIADKPWERNGITSYGNVFGDDKYHEYRMYYVPIDLKSNPPFYLCLATSKDGIHWEKPSLGAVEWRGSKKNNIVISGCYVPLKDSMQ